MKEVEYKLFYKMSGTNWKHFTFDAKNDMDAIGYAGRWAADTNPNRYGLEKILTEKVRLV